MVFGRLDRPLNLMYPLYTKIKFRVKFNTGPNWPQLFKSWITLSNFAIQYMGVARIFKRGGGGITLCQIEGTHEIVMLFSPPVVDCLLKNV